MTHRKIKAMPLRHHFRSSLDNVTGWEDFHGGWPMVIVQKLAKIMDADKRDASPSLLRAAQLKRHQTLGKLFSAGINPAARYWLRSSQ